MGCMCPKQFSWYQLPDSFYIYFEARRKYIRLRNIPWLEKKKGKAKFRVKIHTLAQ